MKGKVVIVGLFAELRPASGKMKWAYRAEFLAFPKTRLVRSECGRVIGRNRIVGER